jgi:hypothetical protein
VEDDRGILDRLAIDVAQDGDLNVRCGRGRFVLAAAAGALLLGASGERTTDHNKRGCE